MNPSIFISGALSTKWFSNVFLWPFFSEKMHCADIIVTVIVKIFDEEIE